jgi:hypothetical protein
MIEQAWWKIVNLASQAGRRGRPWCWLSAPARPVCQHDAVDGAGFNRTRSTSTASRPESSIPRSGSVDVVRDAVRLGDRRTEAEVYQSIPLGRIEQPEDVTSAAIFQPPPNPTMTQQTTNVDGGNWRVNLKP